MSVLTKDVRPSNGFESSGFYHWILLFPCISS